MNNLAHRLPTLLSPLLSLLLLISIGLPAQAAQFKGRLEWVHKVELRVLESGVVKKMNVTVGQTVKKGATLLQMDQREYKAKLLEAEARLAHSKSSSAKAKREYDRTQELYERALIADEELKEAELKQATAKANQASAKATLALAKIALERTELHAPFHAIIVSHNVWEGDVIYKTLQRTPPLTIAPSNQMLARILVTGNIINRYKKGQPATVIIKGKQYKGQIHSLGVQSVRIDTNGAIYELDVIFNRNRREVLREAEIVKVNLP